MVEKKFIQIENRAGGILPAMKMVGVTSLGGWYDWRSGRRTPSAPTVRLIELYLAMSSQKFKAEKEKYCG